jgi:hypothetical protein
VSKFSDNLSQLQPSHPLKGFQIAAPVTIISQKHRVHRTARGKKMPFDFYKTVNWTVRRVATPPANLRHCALQMPAYMICESKRCASMTEATMNIISWIRENLVPLQLIVLMIWQTSTTSDRPSF